jgi:hypothetical protein
LTHFGSHKELGGASILALEEEEEEARENFNLVLEQ